RELHARRPLLSRRGAGALRLLDGDRLQFDRHRLLRRRRHGPGAVDQRRRGALRPLGGRHPPRPAIPEEPPLPQGTRLRNARPALCRPFPLPPDGDLARRRIVYTQMLNARGGIESDLTVTRLSETAYFLVVPGATLQRDLAWLRRHVADDFVVITDVTAAEAVICLMGPDSRKLIQKVSPNDFSNEANPFGTFQEIEIGMGLARAHRVTYVGELGWELYVSTEQAAHVFEAIADAGADIGL